MASNAALNMRVSGAMPVAVGEVEPPSGDVWRMLLERGGARFDGTEVTDYGQPEAERGQAFSVLACEQLAEVEIEGIKVKMVVDRIKFFYEGGSYFYDDVPYPDPPKAEGIVEKDEAPVIAEKSDEEVLTGCQASG